MKYVITFEDGNDSEAEIVVGKDAMMERVKQMYDDGYVDSDDDIYVYPLGAKMTATVESVVKIKGEK